MLKDFVRRHFKELHADGLETSPRRYKSLRIKMVAIMAMVSVAPLLLMAVFNHMEFQSALNREIQNPLRVLLTKTRNSFELFLAERTSTLSFIASDYSFDNLSNEANLKRIFTDMTRVFPGFVDLGLIDENGVQVSYVGPYSLTGVNYSDQVSFQQVRLKGVYISDVFMGFRRFPHVVIAVRHLTDSGRFWILRATIDTSQFDRIIAGMSLDPDSDAFLLNKDGVLQTNSNFYGKVLERFPLTMPPPSFETKLTEVRDPQGREVYLAYTYFPDSDFVLAAVKPRIGALKTWYTVKGDLLFIFVAGTILIFYVAYKFTDVLINRMRLSEERRELAFREMEHTQKLSSIGRLAAGVAHEINNPLAVINEKAGLMKDLIGLAGDFPQKDRFVVQVEAILRTVKRCRDITHRMLGFAKRMEVSIEDLDVNEIISETLGFLDKEALYRKITLEKNLDSGLPRIKSDRGQLQQVVLNLLNNALQAVPDGGKISVATSSDNERVDLYFEDNGCGMSEETLQHIFEPFFTTKKGSGTGLGLSITYGIVKRLGGEINVESKQGVGTKFLISLPLAPAQ